MASKNGKCCAAKAGAIKTKQAAKKCGKCGAKKGGRCR